MRESTQNAANYQVAPEGWQERLDATQTQPAYSLDGEACSASAFYNVACNPVRNVVVEACAGAGKTWMLVSRMVLALLLGAKPESILAITFTRKAAAEMRGRLYQQLRDFSTMPLDKLEQELQLRGFSAAAYGMPLEQAAQRLRGLYAQVLQQPSMVQARTFHSWFASLLQAAPKELLQALDVPPEFGFVEDIGLAIDATWEPFYAAVADDVQLSVDLQALLLEHQSSGVDSIFTSALHKHIEITLADDAGVAEHGVAPIGAMQGDAYALLRGMRQPEDLLSADRAYRGMLIALAQAVLELGTDTQKTKHGAPLLQAVEEADIDGIMAATRKEKGTGELLAFFNTTRYQPKEEIIEQGLATVQLLRVAQEQHAAWLYHQRVLRLVRVLLHTYKQVKVQNGWIDMADVEFVAHRLLSDVEVSGWVQQKLDAQVRYLLIDEFQDTNPLQWQALQSWLEGYTGAGGDLSVFIVGDPKQSIYRFRRAEPEVFRHAKTFVKEGLQGSLLSCEHTRRCAQSVVAASNMVLPQAYGQHGAQALYRAHTTHQNVQGQVVALPLVGLAEESSVDGADEQEEQSGWRSTFSQAQHTTSRHSKETEAEQVVAWLQDYMRSHPDHTQQDESPLRYSDIMVLARTNGSLDALHEALSAHGIPSRKRQSTALVDCLEVQDVLALLDWLCSPQRDLSLAHALASPILPTQPDDVRYLAQAYHSAPASGSVEVVGVMDAPAHWWQTLESLALEGHDAEHTEQTEASGALQRLRLAHAQLCSWCDAAANLPVHDVLQRIYDDAQVLARYASTTPERMRDAVAANLQQLLTLSLEVNSARFTTPYAFVRHLRGQAAASYAVQGVAAENAVQLLTVHSAKGLEAKVVVLFDADAPPARSATHAQLLHWPAGAAHPLTLAFIRSEKHPPPSLQHAMEREQVERAVENCNALYVAMTRAEQTLVVSAHIRKNQAMHAESWLMRMVAGGLLPMPDKNESIEALRVPEVPQMPVCDTASDVTQNNEHHRESIPFWQLPTYRIQPTPPAAQPIDEQVSAEEQKTQREQHAQRQLAAQIGSALHLLLQWGYGARPAADELTDAVRHHLGQRYQLRSEYIEQAHDMAQRIRGGEAAWAWDDSALSWSTDELPIAWQGRMLRIDRLVQRKSDARWWVLDYKSSTQPDKQATLRQQLHTYRQALAATLGMDAVSAHERIGIGFITGEGALVEVE